MERNMKKWSIKISVIVSSVMLFLNSLTVYAYEDMAELMISEQISVQEEIKERIEGEFVFVPNGEDSPYQSSYLEIKYDCQFVDEQGNIYPVEDGVSALALCQHSYVTGTVNKHEVYANGSCKIIFYKAQRCTKCGYTIIGEKTGEQTNNPCPH